MPCLLDRGHVKTVRFVFLASIVSTLIFPYCEILGYSLMFCTIHPTFFTLTPLLVYFLALIGYEITHLHVHPHFLSYSGCITTSLPPHPLFSFQALFLTHKASKKWVYIIFPLYTPTNHFTQNFCFVSNFYFVSNFNFYFDMTL